jgi:hypothetical protein
MFLALLSHYRFAAERVRFNFRHNQARMMFVAKVAASGDGQTTKTQISSYAVAFVCNAPEVLIGECKSDDLN